MSRVEERKGFGGEVAADGEDGVRVRDREQSLIAADRIAYRPTDLQSSRPALEKPAVDATSTHARWKEGDFRNSLRPPNATRALGSGAG